jgi:predicted RNA binding protein YcfA (HicA-like mRNA interferase family)
LGRLRVLSGLEVLGILELHGFREVRRRGSHCIVQKKIGNSSITVPIPLHPELRRGTLLSIIRQSGVPREFFELKG